ncbi:MAG: hypothetical protein JNL82_38295, partial [Myxococcales bacterium]|nr:hypothetical protein [Myxococcales bacterium]
MYFFPLPHEHGALRPICVIDPPPRSLTYGASSRRPQSTTSALTGPRLPAAGSWRRLSDFARPYILGGEVTTMPRKRPFVASLDQVRISRRGDTAIIEYADPDIGDTHYKLGSVIDEMTDQQILDHFNEGLAATERMRQEHEHVAVEIPIGKPQIEYFERGDQWVPRGMVLRCQIHDAGGEPVIEIGEFQDSCRLGNQACFALESAGSRSGLRQTTRTGFQLRVLPVQRSGW